MLAAMACARAPASTGSQDVVPPCPLLGPETPDSVRGFVYLAGSQPGTFVVLRQGRGRGILLDADRALLEQFVGMEVVALGVLRGNETFPLTDGRFEVKRVVARMRGTERLYDGYLRRHVTGDVLEACGGERYRLGPLTAKEVRDGARVVITDLESPAGVIKELRPGTP
jgi:hypothetical protein